VDTQPPEDTVIVLGVILLVLGWLTGLSILYTLGVVLLIVGVVLFALGASGRPVGGRQWY
jgi:membrane-bound ClpP family serine protease